MHAALTGLVLDETNANFVAANPSAGGNMASLNLASMASQACTASCSFARSVRSTSPVSHNYTLTFSGPTAAAVSVTPATFTIAAGATQVITVTVDGTALATGWNFDHLEIAGDDVLLPLLHMPIAIRH